ncbi:glutamine-hydrolyzing carbamoyl-phosphate synthase small subunit [Ferruginibacter sp. HRS2-29]|uniref:glutamine-hydrolyzing carbamoyl-phosphate synthase small subunit n=1 Tax=Ferruginibacter sp. HRS2-29 TaxID=2487334 RepID=UPI0020CE48EA|nr:glutamine-hydrolyzing carbamoyl-phosphate synthase small subunit [Ferruginibacter sp. HRS2-29]MCP9750827.1 carbamoyl-phosphate synthase small subunit [Ferruginibacter sp. HRS2-29]
MNETAILILEDGTIIHGNAFGKKGTATGELCFNTGMTGYQEVFTDPSYYGQVLIMNSVHTGNYGVKEADVESGSVKVKAVIGRNLEEKFSRFLADRSLQQYFEDENLVAIDGVDTRALVAHVRTKGAMNCIISSDEKDIEKLKAQLKAVPSMDGLELASVVSTTETYTLGDENSDLRVAVLDFGIKKNILNCLTERGVFVKVFNAKTPFEELEKFEPHGYFISNGPGDPAPMDYAIKTVKQILAADKPLFGICLGHQLLALANDIDTFKMHHGHRGLNHPVKNIITGKSEITTQNHGFGVNPETVKTKENIEITHMNLNDNSIEGIRVKGKKAFSVQYHPEATPGPHDSRYLFDDFVGMMK